MNNFDKLFMIVIVYSVYICADTPTIMKTVMLCITTGYFQGYKFSGKACDVVIKFRGWKFSLRERRGCWISGEGVLSWWNMHGMWPGLYVHGKSIVTKITNQGISIIIMHKKNEVV